MEDFDLNIAFDTNMDFDLDGFGDDILSDNRYCLPKLHKKIRAMSVRYEHAEKLVENTHRQIMSGDTIHALLSGNFIFGDFIEALAVKENLFIDELTLSTLSLSKDNIDSFHNLLSGDFVQNLNIIVSDYFWSHNRQNAPYIYGQLDIDDKFQLAVSGVHTKITLIKTGDKKIVITGSANMRSRRSIEEITIQTNPELYDFHIEWHNYILSEYATIKKSIRGNALYDSIIKNIKRKITWDQE